MATLLLHHILIAQSYEGFHVGCMYDEPLRHFLDTDERRFGGFGRLTPNSSHPIFNAKDSRPHSVKVYLPSSTCAVYVRESVFVDREALRNAVPVSPRRHHCTLEWYSGGRSKDSFKAA